MKTWLIVLISAVAVFLIVLFVVSNAMWQFTIKRKPSKIFAKIFEKIQEKNSSNFAEKEFFERNKTLVQQIKNISHEELYITSNDNLKLCGRLYQNPSSKVFVIACHGHGSNGLEEFANEGINYYLKKGFNLLLVDHRASGSSEGKYYGFGTLECEDTLLWLDKLIATFGGDICVFFHGISMGGATVCDISGRELPEVVKGIVSDCAYTSPYAEFKFQLKKMGVPNIGILPIVSLTNRIFAKYSFKKDTPIQNVGKAYVPMLFIHGEKDDFVPTSMVYELYEKCTSLEKTLVTFENAPHALSYYFNVEKYNETLDEFFLPKIS